MDNQEIIPVQLGTFIPSELPTSIGAAANQVARKSVLEDYQERKSTQTLRRQRADIALFEQFLASAGSPSEGLAHNLQMWSTVTWGLVEAFSKWQLSKGYATGSINVRLATIKAYCQLAAKAEYLPPTELAMVQTVKGYRQAEARNIDEKRSQTRQEGAKKALPVSLSPAHVALLKTQPDTARGRRDALMMCLLLDHGLRVGEVADLDLSSICLPTGQFTFYRHKVDKSQVHNLSPDTFRAAQAYLVDCPPDQEPLFIGICSKARIDTSSINARVGQMGEAIGIKGLSPHDCRHDWAKRAIQGGTDTKSLQDAGGWNSPAMPLRYVESAKVANEGVKLAKLGS